MKSGLTFIAALANSICKRITDYNSREVERFYK